MTVVEKKFIRVGVGAIVFRGDEVLVVRRGKAPFEGAWSIPGGSLEFGEALEAGALREVMEETGVAARIIGGIGVFEALPGAAGEGRHVVMIDFAAEWMSGEPVAGDDASAAEFVTLDEARRRWTWNETRIALDRALLLRDGAAKAL